MYKKAKKIERSIATAAFNTFKKDTAKEQKRWRYVNKFVTQAFEEDNTKPFWKFVNSQRPDSFGIQPMKKDGKLYADSKVKAEIMLEEFKSVFTRKDKSYIPSLYGTPYSSISDLHISEEGVAKLVKELNPNKASGPDEIPCRVLKELAGELAPVVAALFHQTLENAILPKDWTEAIISPIYNKAMFIFPQTTDLFRSRACCQKSWKTLSVNIS